MMFRKLLLLVVPSLGVLFALAPALLFAQSDEDEWAPVLQEALASEIEHGSVEQLYDAVYIAKGLGPSRMTEAVRFALITRLEMLNVEQDVAAEAGIPLEEIVNGESLIEFVDLVASLQDPRAIPALLGSAPHCYSKRVAQGLASFGERAIEPLLQAVNDSEIGSFARDTPLTAISMMVQDGGAEQLSSASRREVVRLARSLLYEKKWYFIFDGIDMAVGLNDAELNQEIEVLANDRGLLSERGIEERGVEKVRESATKALRQLKQRK